MKAIEQQSLSLIPIQLRVQDEKIRELELRIIALENERKLPAIPKFVPSKKIDGRTTRWQK